MHVCRLYANSLTLSPDGAVHACPRHDGTAALGHLLHDQPDELIRKRGQHQGRLARAGACATCTLHGRFAWPVRRGPAIDQLFAAGRDLPAAPEPADGDLTALPAAARQHELACFAARLAAWRRERVQLAAAVISIEVPVFKGGWLIPCIESVLRQSHTGWSLSLLWDGGDDLSRQILQRVEAAADPRITVHFHANRGIAAARRFLTDHSDAPWILTLDDDDLLAPEAVAALVEAARERPWSGIIRARRGFIDPQGRPVAMDDWFPFAPRRYQNGMVSDLYNHSQPALIRRSAYARTAGWEGFDDFLLAGEDCDIFTKIEQVAPIELLDRCLYHYRLHPRRTSHRLGPAAAEEMWRRLADQTIARLALPLRRLDATQPFRYQRTARPRATAEQVEYVIPFWESDEQELAYPWSRPATGMHASYGRLPPGEHFQETLPAGLGGCDRLELSGFGSEPLAGLLTLTIAAADAPRRPLANAACRVDGRFRHPAFFSLALDRPLPDDHLLLTFTFQADAGRAAPLLLPLFAAPGERPHPLIRLYRRHPGYGRRLLDRCLRSLAACAVADHAIHVIAKRQSAAANRNDGFARTRRPLVCFLDDDVTVDSPAVISGLLEQMDHLDADLASPKILDPQGRLFCADPYFDRDRAPVRAAWAKSTAASSTTTRRCPGCPPPCCWCGARYSAP